MTTSELKTKLLKSISHLKMELGQTRTGRASPSLVEDVVVDAYDSKMTIKELGTITLLDTQTLVVSPWDKSVLGSIGKALRESNLGLNPIEDTDRLRIPVPALTEERRKELAKVVSSKLEETKNAIRNIRQDMMKDIEKDFDEKNMGEDEKFSLKEETEKIVKEFVSQAEEISETKKDELMTV